MSTLRAILAVGLCAACLPPQQSSRTRRGAGLSISRGPTISAELVRAADGANATRVLIDAVTPGCDTRFRRIAGGVRGEFRCRFDAARVGKFELAAELDLLDGGNDGSWDLLARIKRVPRDLAVSSLGFEFEMADVVGMQRLLIPTFSGGEFDEPAQTIPPDKPLDTKVANSIQATAYYGDDGTGLLMFARDPSGTRPKHLLYRSGNNRLGQPSVRLALEYYMPNTHVGNRAAATPVATAAIPYSFDPRVTSGWYVAAKIYRRWIEAAGRGAGGILGRGRLENRADVPQWMRELDLFISEPFGWYPEKATVPDPLLHLRRLRSDLGARYVHVGLWFWSNEQLVYGRSGSWLPLPRTVAQIRALLADGIRFSGYTIPCAFDVTNPLLFDLGLFLHLVEDRNGQPGTILSRRNGQPVVSVKMDLAAAKLADWYKTLGHYHASESGLAGFYSDFPVAVQFEDYRRSSGDRGITESNYRGFLEILRKSQEGAREAGRDFVQYHEAAFEWLIPVATAGQGATGVLGRAYPKDTRTRGVPFFQAVYSGYTLFWPADEKYGPLTLALDNDTYGEMRQSNMSRLLAEGFTWGAILNSSEPELRHGKLFYELDAKEPRKSVFAHHKRTLQNLIALRKLARPWLVYGEMLQSPAVGGDEVDMTIKVLIGSQVSTERFRKLAVPTTAWRASDGTIVIVAANGGRSEAAVMLDLARLELQGKWGLWDVLTHDLLLPDERGTIRLAVGGGLGRLLAPVRLP